MKDKVVVVTGGASGIGKAASMMFASEGAKVLIADLSEKAGQGVAEEIIESGGSAAFVKVDVTREGDVQAMVDAAVDRFGRLDCAFNNAGVNVVGKLLPDLSVEEYERVVNINQRGVFICMKYEITAMRRTGGGAIVNTASGLGVSAMPLGSEYIASKHGVVGLTRAASAEVRETGVRVNAVLPGLIETPMTEPLLTASLNWDSWRMEAMRDRHSVGRLGQPEDVANAAKWLLSDQSAFVNGAALLVDGGFHAR